MTNISVLYFACYRSSLNTDKPIFSYPHFQPNSHQMYWADSAEVTCAKTSEGNINCQFFAIFELL
jgi:hypothetical protein